MCPNWCENRLEIKGKTEDLRKFREYAKSSKTPLDFNNFIPYPKRFADLDRKPINDKDGYNSGGYEWCIANWGTKWNSCDAKKSSVYNQRLCYDFDTAWSPPAPIIRKMGELFPSLHFILKYWGRVQGNTRD